MILTRASSAAAMVLLLASTHACSSPTPIDSGLDGGETDGPGEAAAGDALVDADEAVSGEMTLLIREASLTDERLCDLDGDGREDNAFAELGSPSSQIAVMGINGLLNGALEFRARMLLHVPLVEDLAGPTDADTVLIFYHGIDNDGVYGSEDLDDFSGEETFYVNDDSIDACGEPLSAFPGTRLVAGSFSAASGNMLVPMVEKTVTVRSARIWGEVAPYGESADLEACGHTTARDLSFYEPLMGVGELTVLEVFLSGGTVFGYPEVPGLTPDLDFDGDGLERFVLDGDSRIVECIDGDLTVIPGRDCWLDERISDGFSLNLAVSAIPAVFGGLEPDWERQVEGECEGGPPEASLFDPR